jgi:hypothetical protein
MLDKIFKRGPALQAGRRLKLNKAETESSSEDA